MATAHLPGPRHTRRPGIISLIQLALAALLHFGATQAMPVQMFEHEGKGGMSPDDPELWIFLAIAVALVLLGGAFAGLTIALMGQDEIYLQVIAESGEGTEKKNAAKVLRLLKRGKHWVLVTLLVGNVITNETLPIILDRSIGGGYAAAISSTVLVIIFGEIVPQSICVRFGLPIGASLSWLVLGLMWICAPITWPIAKLLDYLLGEDHGTTYKKAGLKTLVTLHKTIGTTPGDRLNEDEVTIISGVLDLKTKSVGSIMTPMNDVFTLPANAILDEEMMDDIMREGYSRIPIYEPKNRGDFVGMLLVKMLITYDPEDAKRVEDFALATLPETRPETSCLDIINFFQQGKSHMVLVSDFPGKCYGALGVVTLEDVIEELIGEEIIDESDVYIDVHKAIRRIPNPGQFRGRVPKGEVVADPQHDHTTHEDAGVDEAKTNGDGHVRPKRLSTASNDARSQTYTMRRRSSTSGSPDVRSLQARPNTADWRQQFNRLGPSNAASRPKATRVGTVMIKPGVSTIREGQSAVYEGSRNPSVSVPGPEASHSDEAQTSGIRPTLDKGESTSDAVQALHTSYGTLDRSRNQETEETTETTEEKAIRKVKEEAQREEQHDSASHKDHESDPPASAARHKLVFPSPDPNVDEEQAMSHFHRTGSTSTLGSLHSNHSAGGKPRKRTTARSGSITEQLIDSGGVQKLVLEMTESNDDEGEGGAGNSSGSQQNGRAGSASALRRNGSHRRDGGEGGDEREARSRRRQRRKKKAKGGDESTPLLDRET